MAGLRFALIILGAAAALQFTLAQMMMVPPPLIMRHPNHPQHIGHIMQPVQITEMAQYSSPKEPIDEERLQQRIKELEASKQALRQKQLDLDDKIAILHEEVLRCEKQIAEDQQEIHKLEELERLHYMEQVRLEQLIEQQRMVEYQEKLNQERLAQQRAIEEMNRNEERQRSASRKDPDEANDEGSTNGTYRARMEEDTRETYHRLDDKRNEPGKHNIQTRLPERAHKNEPHLTLLGPKPSVAQETLDNLQPKIVPRVKHVIEKKEVHSEPTKEALSVNDELKVVNDPKAVPLAKISELDKTTESKVSAKGTVVHTDTISIDHGSKYKPNKK